MKRFGKIAVCLAGGLALNAGLWAQDLSATNNPLPNDPYAPIVIRNVFGLLPPPDPSKQAEADAAKNLPKITPTGIYAVFDHWKVLFKTSGGVAKPGQPAKDLFYNLAEGEGQDDIEVTHIDAKNSLVTFNNHNIVQELPLTSPTASGGVPAAGGGPIGGPAFAPGGNNNGGLNNGIIHFGGGNGLGGAKPMGNGSAAGPNGGLNPGNQGLSSRAYQPPLDVPQTTPEETAIFIEAQRRALMDSPHPAYNPAILPTTPLTKLNTQDGGDQNPPQ